MADISDHSISLDAAGAHLITYIGCLTQTVVNC